MNDFILYVYHPLVALPIGGAFLWAFVACKDRHWERRKPLLWLGVGWIVTAVLGATVPPIGVAVVLVVPMLVSVLTFAYAIAYANQWIGVVYKVLLGCILAKSCPVCGKKLGRPRGSVIKAYFKCADCGKCFWESDVNRVQNVAGSIRWRVEPSSIPGEETPFCVPIGVIEGDREVGV